MAVKYNSINLKLVENDTYTFLINLSEPLEKKDIDNVLDNLGKGYYADNLDKKLDGKFIDKSKQLKEPTYYYTYCDNDEDEEY